VLPLVGSTTSMPGLRRPDFSASQIIRRTNTALHAVRRVASLNLGVNRAGRSGCQTVNANQRTFADGQRIIVVQCHGNVPST
jgi:hypothetical protein